MNPTPKPRLHRAPHRLLEPELERDVEVAQPPARLAQLVLDHLPDAGALLHQDQRALGELVELDRTAGERVPRRAGEDHLVAEERLERDRAVPPGGADDPELEPPVGDELDDGLRVRDRRAAPAARVVALELAEQERERRSPPGPVEAPISSVPRSGPSGLGELAEQLLLEREQPLRAAVEPEPRLGRLDAPARAVEQLRAEPLLERPHLLATPRAG